MSSADGARATGQRRGWERVVLVLVLIAAFALRTRRIEDFFVGPDDGAYLHSALVHELEHGTAPLAWPGQDVAWVKHLAAHYSDVNATYQHSYLHQLLARWLYRAGCGALQSLRLSSAITGTLTAFFAWWIFARLWPQRRSVGLLAAAIVALVPLHVFYSRTGWGQIGFACFWLAYTGALYRLLVVIPEDDRRAMRRAGWMLLLLSLLAFGWQEGVAPYIVGSGLVVIAAPRLFGTAVPGRGWLAQALRSRRTWTWVWSSIPIGAVTLAIALWSPLAQEHWFTMKGQAGQMPWGQLKVRTLNDLFVEQRVDLQVGWLVIVLAVLGLTVGLSENRRWTVYLVLNAAAGSLILFFAFGDAWLLRAHMPVYVVMFLLAAVGLSSAATWLARRAGHLAGALLVAGVLGALAVTTWISLFGRVEHPLSVQHFYARSARIGPDYRQVDKPILERLRTDLRAGERVGVFADKSAIFRLQDAGIRAHEDYLKGKPLEQWPEWIVGARNVFEPSPYAARNGGPYETVVTDTISRWSLYRRTPP